MMRGMGLGNIGYGLFRPEWLVIVVLAGVIVYLVLFFNSKTRKHQVENELVKALCARYANSNINAEQFREISTLLENTETSDPALLHAMDRLVHGEMDSLQFIRMKDNLEIRKNSCLETNKLKLKYAQGDLSEEQFHQLCGK